MCEHEWITTRAVYRESVVDGYKNHEINRRVCIICLKTKDEIDLEQQLTAANARVAELEKDNARQKRLAIISRLCKNVQACRAEKAEAQLNKMRNCDNWRDCWGEPEEVPGIESCDDHKCGRSTYTQDALIHRMKRMEDALKLAEKMSAAFAGYDLGAGVSQTVSQSRIGGKAMIYTCPVCDKIVGPLGMTCPYCTAARIANLENALSEVLACFRDEDVTITEEMKA